MTKPMLSLAALTLAAFAVSAEDYTLHSFKKIQVSNHFWSEGAHVGDFNHDGKMDVVSGPYWYAGPDFHVRHAFYPDTKTFSLKKADGTEEKIPGYKGALSKENDYSDN